LVDPALEVLQRRGVFFGREALRGGLRMVLIGCGAGIVTWLIGSALGAAVN